MDLISICIPTYNGEKYLQEALDSVKVQTYKNIEVIISDDNSNDKTLEICSKFKSEVDFPVFIYNHTPQGIGANWNNCVKKSNGEYIKFLFQDDILKKKCLEKMYYFLNKYSVEWVACKRNFLYEKEYMTDELRKWLEIFGDLQKNLMCNFNDEGVVILTKKIFKHKTFFSSPLNKIGEPSTIMFHKNVLKNVGPFNIDLKQILDYEYSYRVLKKYRVGIIDERLIFFRLHQGQTTTLNQKNNVNENLLFQRFKLKELFWFLNNRDKIRILKTTLKIEYLKYKKKNI